MLFRQPFPVVIILPNSFKCLFNGEPSPLSGAGGAAFTSLHAPFCFLPSDRKPSILPLTDLDCTSEWHQTIAGDRQRPCPAPRLWVRGVKNSRENLQQRRPWMSGLTRDRQGRLVGKKLNKRWPVLCWTLNGELQCCSCRSLQDRALRSRPKAPCPNPNGGLGRVHLDRIASNQQQMHLVWPFLRWNTTQVLIPLQIIQRGSITKECCAPSLPVAVVFHNRRPN